MGVWSSLERVARSTRGLLPAGLGAAPGRGSHCCRFVQRALTEHARAAQAAAKSWAGAAEAPSRPVGDPHLRRFPTEDAGSPAATPAQNHPFEGTVGATVSGLQEMSLLLFLQIELNPFFSPFPLNLAATGLLHLHRMRPESQAGVWPAECQVALSPGHLTMQCLRPETLVARLLLSQAQCLGQAHP